MKLANEDGEYVEFKFQNDRITESLSFDKNGELYDKGILIYNKEGYIQRINFYKKGVIIEEAQTYWDITVDGQGRIIKSIMYYKRSSSSEYESNWSNFYEYNDKGQINKATTGSGGYQRFVYDVNGNVIQYFTKNSTNGNEFLAYEALYDSMFNPTNKDVLYGYLFLYTFFDVTTTNNLLETKSYNSDSILRSKSTYSYKYNDKGYPIERTLIDSTAFQIITEKNIYTYECN